MCNFKSLTDPRNPSGKVESKNRRVFFCITLAGFRVLEPANIQSLRLSFLQNQVVYHAVC